MRLPGRNAWIFSAKTTFAALLAMYISFAASLDRPAWAMVSAFIASQPFVGATRSKAIYRLFGTMLGAAMTAFMVPRLVQTPFLLCIALAAWVALCLWLSLQDRSPKSYMFMLAGYTCAFVGFPGVNAPEGIFYSSIARVEEIGVGIVCSALIHGLIAPKHVGPALIARLDKWFSDSYRWTVFAMFGSDDGNAGEHAVLLAGIAASPLEIDGLTHHLQFAHSDSDPDISMVRGLQIRLTFLLPLVISIERKMRLLRKLDHPRLDEADVLLQRTLGTRQRTADLSRPAMAADVAQAGQAGHAWYAGSDGKQFADTVFRGTVQEIRVLENTLRACSRIRESITSKASHHKIHRKRLRQFQTFPKHVDQGLAFLSALTAFSSIVLCCAVWILTGWSDGGSMPMIAAVACSFFATMDSPVPLIKLFSKYTLVSIVIALLFINVLLPLATNFESLVLILTPFLMALGLLLANPATSFVGLIVSAISLTLIGITNNVSHDFLGTFNGALALLAGLIATSCINALIRARSPAWSANRIVAAGRADLADLLHSAQDGKLDRFDKETFIYRMLDRMHILTPRIAAVRKSGSDVATDLLAELAVGVNITGLVSAASKHRDAAFESVMKLAHLLETHFDQKSGKDETGAPNEIDTAISATFATIDSQNAREDERLRIHLANIRLALFPEYR